MLPSFARYSQDRHIDTAGAAAKVFQEQYCRSIDQTGRLSRFGTWLFA